MENYEINEETYAIIGSNNGKTRVIEKENNIVLIMMLIQ